MKTAIEKVFVHAARRREVMASDGVFSLRPREYTRRVFQMDGACSLIFDILEQVSGKVAGEIALRVGEGPSLYYLGHIGYHVDPPFRGRHGAFRACRLCLPMLAGMGMRSLVITTDEDNAPSIRTCERLGCEWECTVDVPGWCQSEFDISFRKKRYVLEGLDAFLK